MNSTFWCVVLDGGKEWISIKDGGRERRQRHGRDLEGVDERSTGVRGRHDVSEQEYDESDGGDDERRDETQPDVGPSRRHLAHHHARRARVQQLLQPARKKGSPYSITERRVPQLISAVGGHYFPPGLQLPPQPLRGLLPIFCLVNRGTMGVSSLPER